VKLDIPLIAPQENYIIQRVPIAKWLSGNIILWGVTLALQAAMKNFEGLIALRAILGVFEAVSQPAFTLLSSIWYTREEQGGAVTFWYVHNSVNLRRTKLPSCSDLLIIINRFMMNGLNQILGGLLAFCFSFIPETSPISSWQALFMAYGILTVFWGAFVGWWMPDSPMRAHCFTESDKHLMVERVRRNRTGLQNRKFRKEQVWEVVKDPQGELKKTFPAMIVKCLLMPRSLRHCTYPAFAHYSLRWTWRLQQHNCEVFRFYDLANPAASNGLRCRSAHCNAVGGLD
jgi:MFS family permease